MGVVNSGTKEHVLWGPWRGGEGDQPGEGGRWASSKGVFCPRVG